MPPITDAAGRSEQRMWSATQEAAAMCSVFRHVLGVLAAACALTALVASDAAATPSATPFRGGEYRVSRGDSQVIMTLYATRDGRWVTSSLSARYHVFAHFYYETCRVGRMVFELPWRMRITADGRFSRMDRWPHISGRFSADGSKIAARLQNRALTVRTPVGQVRCPALDHRFELLVYHPAGDYAGTTAQGRPISFTLGGPKRESVTNLAYSVQLGCDDDSSTTHTYSGLSGRIDVSSSPELAITLGEEPFGGGTRSGFVGATWLGATVSGSVSSSWMASEPGEDEDYPSPFSCETAERGVPFTAHLVRRAPRT